MLTAKLQDAAVNSVLKSYEMLDPATLKELETLVRRRYSDLVLKEKQMNTL